MFDIGFLEIVMVGIVALLVLGPERLPHAARMTGAFLGRMSRMVHSVRDEIEREVNVFEMQQRIKKQVEEGMIGDLRKELTEAQKAIQEGFNATASPPANQADTASPTPPPALSVNTDVTAPPGAGQVAATPSDVSIPPVAIAVASSVASTPKEPT